jgi:programmed cell death protein 5
MMDAILTPEAKDRLARVSIVRPDQAQKMKLKLVDMARSGGLKERVTEAQLCALLESSTSSTTTKVTIQRRKYGLDGEDPDDDDSDLM